MSKIEAWETEDVAIVWGTHDRAAAVVAHHDYLVNEAGYDPATEPEAFPEDGEAYWAVARAEYADPVVLTQNEDVWADDQYGSNPVEGWVPYLIVSIW